MSRFTGWSTQRTAPEDDAVSNAGEWLDALANARADLPTDIDARAATYVHPCVVAGEPCLVHERGLRERAPAVYRQIERLGRARNVRVIEDRRSRRRTQRWIPVLVATAALMAESIAAEPAERLRVGSGPSRTALASQVVAIPSPGMTASSRIARLAAGNSSAIRLIREGPGGAPVVVVGAKPAADISTAAEPSSGTPVPTNAALAVPDDAGIDPATVLEAERRLEQTLLAHYAAQPGDPGHIAEDLAEMAAYYARFPDVVALLDALAGSRWQLRYRSRTWMTEARGDIFEVHSATVYFDPRTAARLRIHPKCPGKRICNASPADALLHEMLHVQVMLFDTARFVEQGGLFAAIYPYAHEHEVIDRERALYATMSRYDGIDRPQRHRHAGELIQASCVICIE